MKDGEFGCADDISQGNTLVWWSTLAVSTFDNDPRASEYPRSTRMTGTGPAFVSICNI